MSREFFLSLGDLIEITKDYINGKYTLFQFNELMHDMDVKTYIPLDLKSVLVMKIMNDYLFNGSSIKEVSSAEIEKYFFFLIILHSYAGIDCSNQELWTNENYDLLYPLFFDDIIQFCKNDYDVIKDMFHDTVNAYNIEKILSYYSVFTLENINTQIQVQQRLLDTMNSNPQLMNNLATISELNDPSTKEMMDSIKKAAIKKIKSNNEVATKKEVSK